ncbi:MAG: DUF2064 domain-containing protein [Acidimicrobiia bacterium]|nr:DUF2064 domain-containing protein [Acidimicrobiia bacterium]
MRPALIVLAEDPASGVPRLTDDPDAADTLLARTLELARAVGGVGRVLLFSPPEAETSLTSRSLGFRLWPADGATHGARYASAFRQAGELGYEGALVIGLDMPTIAPDRLTEAATLLEDHQGVLVPGEDGRVAALGLQGAEPTLFPPGPDLPDVEGLRTRARQQLVRLHELEPHPTLTAPTLADYLSMAAAG